MPVVLRTHLRTHDALYAGLPVLQIGPSTVRPVAHDAWADVTRAETRKARIKHQRERKEGRLAPGEVPWRSW